MKTKILIVEAEAIESMDFEHNLNSFGYDVVGTTSTGKEALSKTAELKPDLVLIDIVLKGELNGVETAAQIKEKYDIPIIYIISHPEDSVTKRIKTTLPYGFVIKPINNTELKSTIELALYNHKMEAKLKKSELKYRTLFKNATDAITIRNDAGIILEANPSAYKMFGYTHSELIGKSLKNLVSNRCQQLLPKIEDKLEKQGYYDYEILLLNNKGNEFQVEASCRKITYLDQNAVLCIARDVTKQKLEKEHIHELLKKEKLLTEELQTANEELQLNSKELQDINIELVQINRRLQENKAELEAIIESMTDAVLVSDVNGDLVEFNKAFATYCKFEDKAECSEKLREYDKYINAYLADGTLASSDMWTIQRALRGETASNEEYILERKDTGEKWWGSYSFAPIKDDNNKTIGAVAVARDVTQDKKAENALIESERKYHSLYSSMNEGVAIHKLLYNNEDIPINYELLDVNPAFEQILKLRRENIINKKATEVYGTEEAPCIDIYSEVVRTGNSTRFEFFFKPMSMHLKVSVFSPAPDIFATVFEDITERRKFEERMGKLNRLYATLSQINQSIVRIHDKKKLFETICNVCVDFGKFRMAWIGLIDHETGDIQPVAYKGHEDDYLNNISININTEPSFDKSTIIAVKTGKVVVNENIKQDLPREWCGQALKRGYRSFASIPFKLKQEVIGVLNIYAAEENFFVEDEINLAEEISADISYSINSIEAENDLKITNAALTESERNYRELVDNSLIGVYKTNFKGEILFLNKAMVDTFHFKSIKDMKTRNINDFYANKSDRKVIMDKIKKEGVINQYEVDMITNTGEELTIILSAKLDDDVISGMMMNITRRKKAESDLKKNQERFKTVAESALDVIITTDLDGRIMYYNNSLQNIFGYSKDEMVGESITTLMPIKKREHHVDLVNKFKIIRNPKSLGFTIKSIGLRKDGSEFPIEVSHSIWKHDNENFVTVIIRDVTERDEAENQIKKSLREKEILLKEVHHRVKNNLQIISSLLDLQESYVKEDPKAVNVLQESQNRVLSMAMIYELLYQTKDLNSVNFSDYIQNIVLNLINTYGAKQSVVPIINAEDIYLNIETAIPCGLIISELISNALKHAFKNDDGELLVSFKTRGNDEYELMVCDDGVGLPGGMDYRNVDSLGLKLVDSLVSQLDGTIELDRTKGSKFIITFKELKYQERIK